MQVLSDPPEFEVISRAAASTMMHASPPSSLGHVLFVDKNKHTIIQLKSESIRSGDIISFDFVYECHPSTDDQPTATILQTRHPVHSHSDEDTSS